MSDSTSPTAAAASTHNMDANPADTAVVHIATYGSLRRGLGNESVAGLSNKTTVVGSFRIPGLMYAVPNNGYGGVNYPGAVVTNVNQYHTIEVELLHVDVAGDEFDKLLAELDDFENEPGLEPEYRRIIVEVNGVDAWFYEYIGNVAGLPQVSNGAWSTTLENNAEHKITYDSDMIYWKCLLCGARGLDGEESPRDISCVKL
jgi:gamma-glutamylcyclotransferase (GGCT)/AIG2-like uncharacterized protein YtfP